MTRTRWLRPAPWLPRSTGRLLVVVGIGTQLVAGCGTGAGQPRADWSAPVSSAASAGTPSPGAPTQTAAPAPTGVPPASGSPAAARYVFPVNGQASYARTHHDYPASDIMAACGLPVRAVTDGVILEVSRVDRFDKANPRGADKGGLFVSLLGDDRVRYYGAHLSAVLPGIEAGARVTAGTQLGRVGTTGNSGACHLHFAISPPCLRTGDWWTRRGVLFPWPYLDAWRAGTQGSPVAEVTAWEREHGCPATAPAGE